MRFFFAASTFSSLISSHMNLSCLCRDETFLENCPVLTNLRHLPFTLPWELTLHLKGPTFKISFNPKWSLTVDNLRAWTTLHSKELSTSGTKTATAAVRQNQRHSITNIKEDTISWHKWAPCLWNEKIAVCDRGVKRRNYNTRHRHSVMSLYYSSEVVSLSESTGTRITWFRSISSSKKWFRVI